MCFWWPTIFTRALVRRFNFEGYEVPLSVVPVALYDAPDGTRFVDVDNEYEPIPLAAGESANDHTKINGRRIRISDLVENGLLPADSTLVWDRPILGQHYEATVTEEGAIQLPDGHLASAPSKACQLATGKGLVDGWLAWRVGSDDGPLLDELRKKLSATSNDES